VQVASNGSPPTTLTLQGRGFGRGAFGLATSPSALSFGTIAIGQSSVPSTLTLTNSGEQALRITSMSATGPFALQAGTCSPMPVSLARDGACSMEVVYRPTAEGTQQGTLTVNTNASDKPFVVTLEGEGTRSPATGGGCSISGGRSGVDPTLWLLGVLAVAGLAYRSSARAADRGKQP
jgi:hypothetical protein